MRCIAFDLITAAAAAAAATTTASTINTQSPFEFLRGLILLSNIQICMENILQSY